MNRTLLLTGALLTTLMAGPGHAEDWTRTGPNGTVTRGWDPETGLSTTRNGVNGGSTSAQVQCLGRTCRRDYQLTGPDGQTASGQRVSRRGLYGRRSANTVTGPDGNTVTRVRRAPRYTGPTRVLRPRRW